MQSTAEYILIRHGPGAHGLRLGLGPGLRHVRAVQQLQQLLDENSFWAQQRSVESLRTMLRGSAAAVSIWHGLKLVGFGRASSDGSYRAVLWDVVVSAQHQGQGLGRKIVEDLLEHPQLSGVERIYLMTSNGGGFYERLGFSQYNQQKLMVKISSG